MFLIIIIKGKEKEKKVLLEQQLFIPLMHLFAVNAQQRRGTS